MDREKLIIIQIKEALKYARSSKVELKRLAVILLDNTFELFLTFLIKSKYYKDQDFETYSRKRREKSLKYYDNTLKECKKFDLLSEDEYKQFKYCHDVRNKLYHKSYEEKILIKISLSIMLPLLIKKLNDWNGELFLAFYDSDIYDNMNSFFSPSIHIRHKSISIRNTTKHWDEILDEIKKMTSNQKHPTELFSQHIKLIIKNIKANRAELKSIYGEEFADKNHFYIHTFSIFEKEEIDAIIEDKTESDYREQLDKAFERHKNEFTHLDEAQIDKIKDKIATLETEQETGKAIQKYTDFKSKLIKYDKVYEECLRRFELEVDYLVDLNRNK